MKILLTGKNGQLGWELNRCLVTLGEVVALDRSGMDLLQPDSIRDAIRSIEPDLIVNAAAYTAVDRAESEREQAFAVNAIAPGIMAEEASRLGAALVHYSTDYVFDGAKGSPYTEADDPNPVNVYGESKLAGERAVQEAGCSHLVLRASWVYSLRRESFATRVLGWSRQHKTLHIVSDQVGSPTWCRILAEATAQLVAMGGSDFPAWLGDRRGVYHLAGEGAVSRYDWARAILEFDPHREEQVAEEVLPALTADFPTAAERPLYSALNCGRFVETFGIRLPDWREALRLAEDFLNAKPPWGKGAKVS